MILEHIQWHIYQKKIENVTMANTLKKTAIKRFFQALYFFSDVENGSAFVNYDTKFIDGLTLPYELHVDIPFLLTLVPLICKSTILMSVILNQNFTVRTT